VSAASEASDGRALAGPGSSPTVLADRIAAALVHHEPGWRLPRQTALARRYNVSPAEVDAAIGELSARHLIRRLPDGQLYRASPAEYLVSLEGVPGLAALVDPMGGELDCRSRHVSWRRVPEDIGWSLGVPPGEPACLVRLLWTAAGEPAALATAYLARHVSGPPAGPDSVPAAALSVLPFPGQVLTAPAGPDGDGPDGDGPEGDSGRAFTPRLTEEQRALWVALAGQAATEAGLPADPPFRAALASFLEWDSRQAQARSEDSRPEQAAAGRRRPATRPVPHWDWTAAGPPDVAAASADDSQDSQPAAVPLPGPGEAVSFDAHIRPLFRERDRQSMSFVFDLSSVDDVRTHAAGILERLHDGSMPCDGAWPEDRVAVFQRWTESGQQD